MSSHTPYIIWCETGAVNFLYMRLDLQNPSPCVGVNGLLSLDQAIDGVVERIKSEGTQTQEYPDYVDKDRFDNRMECEVRRRNRNRNRT